MPERKHFEGLDAPLDRWLRVVHDRHMWAYPPYIREKYRSIIDDEPLTLYNHREAFGGPHSQKQTDAESIDRDSLLELTFSG